jgi:hypothetical protein
MRNMLPSRMDKPEGDANQPTQPRSRIVAGIPENQADHTNRESHHRSNVESLTPFAIPGVLRRSAFFR